jgi:hypothetical protein
VDREHALLGLRSGLVRGYVLGVHAGESRPDDHLIGVLEDVTGGRPPEELRGLGTALVQDSSQDLLPEAGEVAKRLEFR